MKVQKLIEEYANWLKSEITFEQMGEYFEITTPYLDNANDYLQLYVRQDGDSIYFTDDGAIIDGLAKNGVQLTSARKEQLKGIMLQYGVKIEGNELTSKAPLGLFPQKNHMFIQAMLRADDMLMTAKNKVTSFFLDDIQEFFLRKDIYFTDNVQFTGISGFAHTYEFLLQRTRNKPERLCRAVNNPKRSTMENVLFSWNDTKPSRKNDSQLVVFLNDQNPIGKGVEDALSNYEAKVIRWSERESNKSLSILVA